MRRTLDSDEFQVEFPDEHDSFCDFYDRDVSVVKFKIDLFSSPDEEDKQVGAISAWADGEEIAFHDVDTGWEETKEEA